MPPHFSAAAAYQIAAAHARRCQGDLPFDWLDRADAERGAGFALITTDPWFDSLRNDSRLKAPLSPLNLAK